MNAHSITIETKITATVATTKTPHHRWKCSCSKVGSWNASARNARSGGSMHVRLAENPRPRKEP